MVLQRHQTEFPNIYIFRKQLGCRFWKFGMHAYNTVVPSMLFITLWCCQETASQFLAGIYFDCFVYFWADIKNMRLIPFTALQNSNLFKFYDCLKLAKSWPRRISKFPWNSTLLPSSSPSIKPLYQPWSTFQWWKFLHLSLINTLIYFIIPNILVKNYTFLYLALFSD